MLEKTDTAWARRAMSADPAKTGRSLAVNPIEREKSLLLAADDGRRKMDDALYQSQFAKSQLSEEGELKHHDRRLRDLDDYKRSSGSFFGAYGFVGVTPYGHGPERQSS